MSQFIVFDGPDASGKTTQIKEACAHLINLGHDVVTTREPGGTPLAEDIRRIMLSPATGYNNAHEEFMPDTELLLAFAAREQHIKQRIQPALEAGKTVLCDRFTPSTYVYQVFSGGASLDLYRSLESNIVGHCQPSGYLLFDVSPEVAFDRLNGRGSFDRMESRDDDFKAFVNKGYRQIIDNPGDYLSNSQSVEVIDANGDQEEVSRLVKSSVQRILQANTIERDHSKSQINCGPSL